MAKSSKKSIEGMQAIVNDTFEFDLSEKSVLDIVMTNEGIYHMIHNEKSYRILPKSYDINRKEVELIIEGKEFKVQIKDHFDQLIDQLGFSVNPTQIFKDIKAPMPGLVLDIMVKVGDEVNTGDTLLILEAMKMENVIKAPGDGKVKKILVKASDAIEKGTVLIEMD